MTGTPDVGRLLATVAGLLFALLAPLLVIVVGTRWLSK